MSILNAKGTDPRLIYWVKVWKDLCRSIENGDICMELINPHMLILDILEEYEFNRLKNKRNLLFYIQSIEGYLKENLVIRNFFIKEYRVLKDTLENRDYEKVNSLCQEINDKFKTRKYAHFTFELLKNIFENRIKDNHYKKIKILSLELIVEFIIDNHSMTNIMDYVDTLFKLRTCTGEVDYHFMKDIKDFGFKLSDYKSQEYLKNAANTFIRNLTVKKRIEAFENYINKEKTEVNYIFKAIGVRITGNTKSYALGNCVAYDPHAISYLNDDLSNKKRVELFTFSSDIEADKNFCNIKVTILKNDNDFGSNDDDIGFQEAYEQALYFFNTIKIIYGSYKFYSYLESRYYLWVNEDKERFAFSGIDLKNEIEENPETVCSEDMISIERSIRLFSFYKEAPAKSIKLINRSVLFYAKGKEAQTIEDRLLNFWICIETLLNTYDDRDKYNTIQTTLSNTAVLFCKTEGIKKIFKKIRYHHRTDLQIFPQKNVVTLPQRLSHKLGMNGDDKPNYLAFIDSLNELKHCTKHSSILEKIDSMYRFYYDNEYALNLLMDEEKSVKKQILYIYKYRNQIVHNGYVNRSILPYIVKAVECHAKHLLLLFIASFSLYKLDPYETIKKIDVEKAQLYTNLKADTYFELKSEIFMSSNLFFDT